MEQMQRKKNRLTDYDYSTAGAYFITVCTTERRCLFWNGEAQTSRIESVGATIGRPQTVTLSTYGHLVDEAVRDIPRHYPTVAVDAYTVMPNHVHILLHIHADENGRAMPAPTISTIIQQTKGIVTKRVGFSLWQRSYHDHVVRNRQDYDAIWEYIADNPRRWREDTLYCEE